MKFWLGTCEARWLAQYDKPFMVSRRRLEHRKGLPIAVAPWVLDSGGFTELSLHGEWTLPAHRYIAFVRRAYDEIGKMQWAAPQDWMCEPWIVAKTGLTVHEHIRRTVANFCELKTWAPDLPVIPVLQGWDMRDYEFCVEQYGRAGVDLTAQPIVGLGSVCRRQATPEIGAIVTTLAASGLNLHGFGCKIQALRLYGGSLASADSMAWSYRGRRQRPCPETTRGSCATCWHFAATWYERVTAMPIQMTLEGIA